MDIKMELSPHGHVGLGTNGPFSVCSGCGLRILDRFYLQAVEKEWHHDCLRCHDCSIPLSNELTCFARDGDILCKEDYARRYSLNSQGRCGRCGGGIGSQELVMRAKDLVFHLNCFVCAVCLRILNKGDHFGMRNSSLYCQQHYELVLDEMKPNCGESLPSSPHQMNFFNGAGTGQKGRPRKRNKESVEMLSTPPIDLLTNPDSLRMEGYESSSSSCPGQQRTKRMRTSFKHNQLRTMKSYFALNQNPDAKDLKNLAMKTGLSKRVLQVWFQNARAKWRRNMVRSEGSVSGGGTTPTRPEDFGSGSTELLNSDDGGFSSDIY